MKCLCLLRHEVKPLCTDGVRSLMVLSYPEDGRNRFARNLWRHFAELYGVTYQEPYLASQRIFIAKTDQLLLFGKLIVCYGSDADCRHFSVNSRCVLERGSGLMER